MKAYTTRNPADQSALNAVCEQNCLWHHFDNLDSPLAYDAWDKMARNLHKLPDEDWTKLEIQHVQLHGYGIY